MSDQLKNKLGQLRTGALHEKERKKLLSLFHESTLEYNLKNELYQQLENDPEATWEGKDSKPGFDRLWERIETSDVPSKGEKIQLNFWYWAAAILVVGLLIGNLVQYHYSKHIKFDYTAIAPEGSVSELILPDGTVIFLNSASEIRYASNMDRNSREVYLKGEAWFDVQKSKDIPFLVHTSYYDVRVMGTEFNVKAYAEDDEVVTTLEEGSILVQSTKNLKLIHDVSLVPGEQLVYNKRQKSLRVSEVKARLFTSWKDNKLIFINMSLGELVTLLERKYGISITVEDEQILSYHYDGTIRNQTIIEVLDILQKTLPINYVIKDQEVVINKK